MPFATIFVFREKMRHLSWLLAIKNFLRMVAVSWRWFQQRWEEMKQRLFGVSQYHEFKKKLKKGNTFKDKAFICAPLIFLWKWNILFWRKNKTV